MEKQLEKKANALHNVQNCLEQLKGTHTNAHVWEAYKNALHAFNTTYKETGISEEAVDDTMLKLGEVNCLILYFATISNQITNIFRL